MKPAKLKAGPGRTESKPQTGLVIFICVFLTLAVLAVFGQAARFQFVGFDDPVYVYENAVVEKGLSVKAVGWAFSHAQVSNWVPLTTLSHMLDCQLFGLRAGAHHMVNVFLHAANASLLFLILRQMTGSLWRSAFVAALFAIHPLRAESVAWVSERKDVLSGFFFLLTIGAYVRRQPKPTLAGYVTVALFFSLALLAKSMVATLPLMLLLLDYWPLGQLRNWRDLVRLTKEKIPLFALSAAACAAAVLAPGLLVADRIPVSERMGNALVSCVVYARQMAFPAGLAALYPYPVDGEPVWKVCAAILVVAGITAGVVACRRERPGLLVGWLWYLGMLAPVIGIFQISSEAAHADRYTYLPEIGLAIAVTWAVGDWSIGWKHRRVILGGLMAMVVCVLGFRGYIQTAYWKDSETLWTRALECTSGNSFAHYSLGIALFDKGEKEAALAQYREALEIKPNYAEARNNLGLALFDKGETDEAIAQYRRALEIKPDYAKAHYNLGYAFAKEGRTKEAIAQYRQALEVEPDFVKARNNLAVASDQMGNPDEAIAQYRKALEIQTGDAEIYVNLGNALSEKGQLTDAIAQYREALKINPVYEDAHFNLAVALFGNGDVTAAIAEYREALKILPGDAAAHTSLGIALARNGRVDESLASYREAIKLNPRYADAYANLGVVLAQKGETKQAIDAWQHALSINPDQANVQNNLAWLLATTPDPSLRDGTRSVALAVRANRLTGGANPIVLHTLAAAYAEMGRFAEATATARRASELATVQKNGDLAARLRTEIKLYEANTPIRDATR